MTQNYCKLDIIFVAVHVDQYILNHLPENNQNTSNIRKWMSKKLEDKNKKT